MTKDTKCAYQSNKYNTDFLLVLQCLNWELLVTSTIYYHNPYHSKYIYHF